MVFGGVGALAGEAGLPDPLVPAQMGEPGAVGWGVTVRVGLMLSEDGRVE